MRVKATENSGMRAVDLMIGLEHLPVLIRDIRELARQAGVPIASDTNLGGLLHALAPFNGRGFGGGNASIFEEEATRT